jgi:hypothetical protein
MYGHHGVSLAEVLSVDRGQTGCDLLGRKIGFFET